MAVVIGVVSRTSPIGLGERSNGVTGVLALRPEGRLTRDDLGKTFQVWYA